MEHFTPSFQSVVSNFFAWKPREEGEGNEEEESKEGNLDAARIHSYSESAPGNRCQEMFIAIIQEFLKLLSWVVFCEEKWLGFLTEFSVVPLFLYVVLSDCFFTDTYANFGTGFLLYLSF